HLQPDSKNKALTFPFASRRAQYEGQKWSPTQAGLSILDLQISGSHLSGKQTIRSRRRCISRVRRPWSPLPAPGFRVPAVPSTCLSPPPPPSFLLRPAPIATAATVAHPCSLWPPGCRRARRRLAGPPVDSGCLEDIQTCFLNEFDPLPLRDPFRGEAEVKCNWGTTT
ncbi:hypothetical protein PVAP13_6KG246106, partial [Panicum virgatum]